MGIDTGIAWANHTASPWHGCAHATYTDAAGNEHGHQGCLDCYAEKMSTRNPGTLGVWGKDGTRVMSATFHANCRRWNKAAQKGYARHKFAIENFQGGEYDGIEPFRRPSVFPSICDPFESWEGPILNSKGDMLARLSHEGRIFYRYQANEHEPLATMSDLRRDLFSTIDACPMLDFLLLTKRPQDVRGMWPKSEAKWVETGIKIWQFEHPKGGYITSHFDGRIEEHDAGERPTVAECKREIEGRNNFDYRPNIHLLTSISTQADADALIPHLLMCRDLVPVLGVSAEPLLGEIDFRIPNWSQCQIPYVNKIAAQERYNVLTGEVTTEHGNTFKSSDGPTLDWLIIGNESKGKGVGRLPGGTEEGYWRAAKSLVEQCRAAEVPVFFKQGPVNGKTSHDPNEWPEWARVQEFPRRTK